MNIVKVGNVEIGGKDIVIIAGPCSVENEKQLMEVANEVKKSGANMLRGGIVKPRTSPYDFQGLGLEALKLMKKAKEETGLPIISEIMSEIQLAEFGPELDMIQIGARNMQNFELLKAVGKSKIPVLLKRGMSATINEWLMAAEYIKESGNDKIVLCERGIRTFETAYRNVMDLNSIPMIKRKSDYPIIADPSHATGKWWMVRDLARASIAVGANGLMIEVHNDPDIALSDGKQSLTPKEFNNIMIDVKRIRSILG